METAMNGRNPTAPSGSRDDAWEPDDYPRTSPSPYDGLRTQWLIVALSAVSVAWVVVAIERAFS
jgi:hypothetical protein